MTPDLQARIEAAARECVRKFFHLDCLPITTDTKTMITTISDSLTTLAEQIIAEKDAEAAAFRRKLQDIATAGLLGCLHGETLNRVSKLLHDERHTAGRDTLAELTSLRERVRELEGALGPYLEFFIESLEAEIDDEYAHTETQKGIFKSINDAKLLLASLTTTEPSK